MKTRALTVIGLIGLCWFADETCRSEVVSAEPSSVAASVEPSMPVYKPPKDMSPRARIGGSMRGTEGKDPEIVALVPDHVGLTTKKAPSLTWFLSKSTNLPLRFTLRDDRVIKPLYEGPLPTPRKPGIQTINLKDFGLTLEPEVQYRWFVSAERNKDSHSQDIVAGGIIERCEFGECLMIGANPVCDQETVVRNAERGFWYDAMACLCELIEARPADKLLRRQRAALLKQVGLPEIAEWDLKQPDTP